MGSAPFFREKPLGKLDKTTTGFLIIGRQICRHMMGPFTLSYKARPLAPLVHRYNDRARRRALLSSKLVAPALLTL